MNSILKTFPSAVGVARDITDALAAAVFTLPERGVDKLLLWETRLRNRHALATMETRLLDDMGMTRKDALIESRKPFWRA